MQTGVNYKKVVKYLFELFFDRIYVADKPKILKSDRDMRMIDTFQKTLSKHYPITSIDLTFLISYFAWAFNYWADKKDIEKRKRIELGWIIGPKMVLTYKERNKDSDYYVRAFLTEIDINTQDVLYELTDHTYERGVSEAEEVVKGLFDDEARLYNCIQRTTLWHPLSRVCFFCRFQNECKEILKEKAIWLYYERTRQENKIDAKAKS